MRTFSVLVVVTFYCITLNKSESNYGPYKIIWEKIETCKGPKRGDCGEFKLENTQNPSNIIVNMNLPKDCPATSAKIVISSKQKNGALKKMFNYVVGKPCRHFVLGPVFKKYANISNIDNCNVIKGNYSFNLNYEEKSMAFLGSSFFYGAYSYRVLSYNNVNNLFCILSEGTVARIT